MDLQADSKLSLPSIATSCCELQLATTNATNTVHRHRCFIARSSLVPRITRSGLLPGTERLAIFSP